MGVGCVKNYQKLRDVIYGRPLYKKNVKSKSKFLLTIEIKIKLICYVHLFVDLAFKRQSIHFTFNNESIQLLYLQNYERVLVILSSEKDLETIFAFLHLTFLWLSCKTINK
jgi:hypothetical protein